MRVRKTTGDKEVVANANELAAFLRGLQEAWKALRHPPTRKRIEDATGVARLRIYGWLGVEARPREALLSFCRYHLGPESQPGPGARFGARIKASRRRVERAAESLEKIVLHLKLETDQPAYQGGAFVRRYLALFGLEPPAASWQLVVCDDGQPFETFFQTFGSAMVALMEGRTREPKCRIESIAQIIGGPRKKMADGEDLVVGPFELSHRAKALDLISIPLLRIDLSLLAIDPKLTIEQVRSHLEEYNFVTVQQEVGSFWLAAQGRGRRRIRQTSLDSAQSLLAALKSAVTWEEFLTRAGVPEACPPNKTLVVANEWLCSRIRLSLAGTIQDIFKHDPESPVYAFGVGFRRSPDNDMRNLRRIREELYTTHADQMGRAYAKLLTGAILRDCELLGRLPPYLVGEVLFPSYARLQQNLKVDPTPQFFYAFRGELDAGLRIIAQRFDTTNLLRSPDQIMRVIDKMLPVEPEVRVLQERMEQLESRVRALEALCKSLTPQD